MPPRYFLKTYGCQMNENDSEIMAGILESKGYEPTDDIGSADIVITNTCSVRDNAERKAKGFLFEAAKFKKANPLVKIGVVGCMAERMADELLKKYPFVDFVLGPNKEQLLGEMVAGKGVRVGDSDQFRDSSLSKRAKGPNAWVTIMEGCDNYCSYCIVPYVRGREKSRPVEDVIKEIEGLDKNVFKEVTLLGQNVNSYKFGLGKLLEEVSRVEGIERIRFMTSHPKDMTDEIIDAVARLPKVCEYFHLPLQSGDDDVLMRMNRGYTRDYYIKLVEKIRSKIPNASITGDAIAGFPGETESQFQNTLDLIKALQLDLVNTAAFDPRPGTAAAKMEGNLDREEVSSRLQKLMTVVEETAKEKNRALSGSVQEIMVDEPGIGRTRTNKTVKFAPSDTHKPGDLVNVRIKSAKSWVLQGELIN